MSILFRGANPKYFNFLFKQVIKLIIKSVEQLHSIGIVHRDIKP